MTLTLFGKMIAILVGVSFSSLIMYSMIDRICQCIERCTKIKYDRKKEEEN